MKNAIVVECSLYKKEGKYKGCSFMIPHWCRREGKTCCAYTEENVAKCDCGHIKVVFKNLNKIDRLLYYSGKLVIEIKVSENHWTTSLLRKGGYDFKKLFVSDPEENYNKEV